MPFENFQSSDPLAYTGINPQENPGVIVANRAPTTGDNANLGTLWIDKPNDAVYALSSITANAANWEILGSPTAAVSQIDGDSGSAAPADGAITLAGTTDQIATSATGSMVTLSLDEAIPQAVEVSLTAAEIKALATTPITLVAAPGAGKALKFMGASFKLVAGSEVLTEAGDNLGIKYTDAAGVQVSQTIESTGFIDQAVDTYTNGEVAIDGIVAASAAENAALVLDNLGSNFAGNASNDATLEISTLYRVVEL